MRNPEDISEEELQGAVKKLLADEHFKQLRHAQERQAYAQKMLGINRRSIDGIGQPVMEIDPVLFHAAARIEEDSQGVAQYGVWDDPIFRRRMKEEGQVREVQSKGVKEIQVGYAQAADFTPLVTVSSPGESRRFHKVY